MPFRIIKGSFHVRNYSPDGDSIRFEPNNVGLVHDLAGSRPRINARNHVQLRIEAIDTLETHYSPPSGGGSLHQPLEQAFAAVERLMNFVQIENIRWDNAHRTVISADDGTPGYILSRTVEKNGRPVAFVYQGEADEDDGDQVNLDVDRLRQSYNYLAIAEGLAYATYYRGLFHDLRDALSQAAATARQQRLGVYGADRTNDGFSGDSLSSITDEHTMMPKLFRRLSEYMVNYGRAAGFKRKMGQSREPVLDLRTNNFTHFDSFIEQQDDSDELRLTRFPEEMVFDEMPTRPTNHFSTLMGSETAAPPRFIETVTLPEEALRDLSL